MAKPVFDIYSLYYDLLYEDKNYSSEVNYIKNLLYNFGITKGNILEFGSGTGKHGNILGRTGYKVHGIELSSDMVARAKTHSNFFCQQGDITKINLDQSFEAVISLFHVLSYQITNNQIKSVFKNAAKHLTVGGLFIFDIWYSPAVHHQKPSVKVKHFKNKKTSIFRIAEPNCYPNKNMVDVKYTFFIKDIETNKTTSFKETHSMRHFSIPELDILAEMFGFERVDAHEFLTKKNPSENTWSICITLKKK